ncbi:MAG: MarR family winged helix-turn-helix transcriptional regulator [Janthinobacterium lividum]
MSRERFDRYVIIAQRFGARTVLFQDAAARHLDLTATQLECFQLVRHEGPMTASDLAQETGLTQASLSVIVDRLVTGRFVSREQDRTDRRRWLLRAHPDATTRVDAVYGTHAARTATLLDDYSDEEFDAALHFMDRLTGELALTTKELTENRPVR